MCKKLIFIIIAALFVFSFSASAQDLSIISTSIADQAVNVDTSVTLTITLNKALAPHKAGIEAKDIIMIGPEIGAEISNLRISGTTISVDLTLASNVTYQVLLDKHYLRAQDGSALTDLLTNVAIFSTGAAIDAGSISGTITPAVPLSELPAYAGLMGASEDGENFFRGVKVNSNGTYTIPALPAGSYAVFAFQDVDGNMSLNEGNYGIGEVTITEGEQKTGVNVTIPTFTVTSITPNDGAVNVDTATTITIVFSDPVDNEEGNNYNLSYGVFPDPLQMGDAVWNAEKTSLSFDVVLNDNKLYAVGVFMARSEEDQWLTESPFYYFSTGSSLPAGSISGTITNPVGSGAFSYAVAVDEEGTALSAGITDRNGDYTIKHLDAGGYIVGATTMESTFSVFETDFTLDKKAKQNSNGNESSHLRDRLAGYYGWSSSTYETPPTAVTVSSSDVPDIDITLGQELKMKLLSTTPVANAVNVATDLSSISMTFNLPLNKPQTMSDVENFFSEEFGFQIVPVPLGAPEGPPMPDFSNNGRTITFDAVKLGITFATNTMYTMVISEAKDVFGSEEHCKRFTFVNPSVIRFTTASALPAKTISGKVSFTSYSSSYYSSNQGQGGQPGQGQGPGSGQPSASGTPFNPDYAMVLLFDQTPGENTSEEDIIGAGLVNLADGSYSIPVENGTYYPAASAASKSKNVRDDFYGWYDPDGDDEVNSVVISGSSVSDVDMTVYGYRLATLTGVIRSRQGKLLSNAGINLSGSNYSYQTSVGYDGRFRIENITPGSYSLSINFGDDLNNIYSGISMEILIIKDMYLPIDIVEVEDHFTYTNTGISPITVQINNFGIPNTNLWLSRGDEIGILTGDGTTVGAVKFDDWQISTPINITVYADDPSTEEKDGYEADDTIVFKYYRQSIDKEYTAEIPSGTLTFSQLTSPIDLSVAIAGKNQLTVKNVGIDSSLQIQFADMSSVNLKFQAGNVTNKEIKVKAMGTNPDTLNQLKQIAAAGVYVIESDEVANESFQARLTFEYTNAMLAEAGISQKDITIAFFDDTANVWYGIDTEVDTVNKIAYCETSHFSVWALTDENDSNVISGIQEEKQAQKLPTEYLLYQNYPNPFNAETVIRYQLPKSSTISLKIYNTMGQEIATLIDSEPKPAGRYTLRWNGMNKNNIHVASGIYFYTLKADNHSFTKKMVYLK